MLTRKSAEHRKADVVAALLSLADKVGPDRLTINDIAREVGVTQAAIFRHFPTKAELWSAVGEVIADRLGGAWDVALAENSTPKDRLRALIGAQLRQIALYPALPCILHSRELNVENTGLRDRFRDLLMRFQRQLVDSLSALADEGHLHPDLQPEDAAVLLTSLVQGIAIRWSLGPRRFALEAEGLRLFDVQFAMFICREAPE